MAESVAVDSRKQNNLPDRRIGRTGHRAGRLRPRELEDYMQAFGMLLLAAATAGDGFGYTDPGVGLKKWLRPHVVSLDRRHGHAALHRRLAGRRRRHGRRQRAAVHQSPRARSTSSTPTACRSAGRRRRAQRRTDLPARPTDRAGPLQLQPGLHLPPEDHQHSRPARRVALPHDRGRPDAPRRPTPTWPTTPSRSSSPPKISTR